MEERREGGKEEGQKEKNGDGKKKKKGVKNKPGERNGRRKKGMLEK